MYLFPVQQIPPWAFTGRLELGIGVNGQGRVNPSPDVELSRAHVCLTRKQEDRNTGLLHP